MQKKLRWKIVSFSKKGELLNMRSNCDAWTNELSIHSWQQKSLNVLLFDFKIAIVLCCICVAFVPYLVDGSFLLLFFSNLLNPSLANQSFCTCQSIKQVWISPFFVVGWIHSMKINCAPLNLVIYINLQFNYVWHI
jgi:hypothetical protein